MIEVYYPQGFTTEASSFRLSPEKVKLYKYLLYQAKWAKAYPSQSGFFVRTAAVTKGGHFWVGGNKEYGLSDAFVHGEEAVISGLRDMLKDDPLEAIAWYHDGEMTVSDFGRPCGKCRDVMAAYAGSNLVLLKGNENNFVYSTLGDYFFDNFKPINNYKNDRFARAAAVLARGGNDVYLPDHLKAKMYGAVLVAAGGSSFPGGHYTNVGYDSVTPVLSAIIGYLNDYPKGRVDDGRLRLSKLVVAAEEVPKVFYRDRQAILELDEILRRYTGSPNPMRVEIIGRETAYETNTEEWLPRPFSPGAFRMDDVMDIQLKKLIGR